jgi:hypothetical protein
MGEFVQRRHIKRLPVMREGRLVGIVSRANLVYAVVGLAHDTQALVGNDAAIRSQVLEAVGKLPWAGHVEVAVKGGIVELSGVILDDHERTACSIRRAAERIGSISSTTVSSESSSVT